MKATKSPPSIALFKKMEQKYKQLIERAYNLRQSDDSLSDVFYFEADKLLEEMKYLKNTLTSSSASNTASIN